MKKIKGLLVAFVALFVFALAMVTANADVDFGLYSVSTTTNDNDTATWDYASVTTATFNNNDILSGGIIVSNAGNTNAKGNFVKGNVDGNGKGGFLDVYASTIADDLGGTIYVPVPAETAAGTFTMWTLDTQNSGADQRALLLNGDKEKKIFANKTGESYAFTADDLTDFSGEYYLKLVGWANSAHSSGREVKISKMQIVLTSGAYEASAANYDVKIYDGTTTLFDNKMTEGTTITYKPAKWGYDFAGFFTDADLTQSFAANTPISGNTTLYTKWNEWPAGTIANPRVFGLDLMAKGYEIYGDANPGQVRMGETYGLLAGNTVFEADGGEKTIGDLGKATHHIKTGGALKKENSTNGIILSVPAAGELVLYVKSGSSSARTIDAIPMAGSVTHTDFADTVIRSEAVDNSAIVKVTLNIPYTGTYKIGSEAGSVLIYYAEFIEHSVLLYHERVVVDEVEHIRLVVKLTNIDDLSDLNFVLKSEAFENDLVLTEAAKIGTCIMDNGEVYSMTSGNSTFSKTYTFGAEDGVVYIKCVVEVGAKYKDAVFKVGITVGGQTVNSTVKVLS